MTRDVAISTPDFVFRSPPAAEGISAGEIVGVDHATMAKRPLVVAPSAVAVFGGTEVSACTTNPFHSMDLGGDGRPSFCGPVVGNVSGPRSGRVRKERSIPELTFGGAVESSILVARRCRWRGRFISVARAAVVLVVGPIDWLDRGQRWRQNKIVVRGCDRRCTGPRVGPRTHVDVRAPCFLSHRALIVPVSIVTGCVEGGVLFPGGRGDRRFERNGRRRTLLDGYRPRTGRFRIDRCVVAVERFVDNLWRLAAFATVTEEAIQNRFAMANR